MKKKLLIALSIITPLLLLSVFFSPYKISISKKKSVTAQDTSKKDDAENKKANQDSSLPKENSENNISEKNTDVDNNIKAVVHAEEIENEKESGTLSKYYTYEKFDAVSDSEYVTKILFTAEGNVKDFKLSSLQLKDSDDSSSSDGKLSFNETELYSIDKLFTGRPLLVSLTFHGSLPEYAISYTDETGSTKSFVVYLSGKDGAVELLEKDFN